ncbi:MAG: DUF5662 family protein [Coriobacteriia bacterium]|nr:DUF5662 family protein [Coriobacteriia bacterium]
MSLLHNAKAHLSTINRHKMLVMRHCFQVGLYRQGLCHDLSKYSPEEFWTGVRYYQGHRSPNTAERDDLGYSLAWLHHKGRNKHHFEYWLDQRANRDPEYVGKPMPTRYVVEMLCDRVAACKVYQGDAYTERSPLEYFLMEQSTGAVLMHEDTRAFLYWLLEYFAEVGEEECFSFVRTHIVETRFTYGEHARF